MTSRRRRVGRWQIPSLDSGDMPSINMKLEAVYRQQSPMSSSEIFRILHSSNAFESRTGGNSSGPGGSATLFGQIMSPSGESALCPEAYFENTHLHGNWRRLSPADSYNSPTADGLDNPGPGGIIKIIAVH